MVYLPTPVGAHGNAPLLPTPNSQLPMTKILLVEDNEMNQDMLTRRLLRRGYEVVCAMDGQTGVDMAYSEIPDLILMDMSLPIMDGWEASRRLKADDKTRSIPIIALTAHAMVGDRQKSMDAGCDDYDTKPVELARLLSKIETLLASCKLELRSDDRPSIVETKAAVIPQQILSLPNIVRSIDPTAATILIVDDIETNRDMLGRRLERAGYTVILAEGGKQGLKLIEQRSIDLVLLDIMMPDFNGIETLQAIRAKYSMMQLPVIMATAKDRSEDMVQAFDLGANDYVTKPIDLPMVLARIQSHLRLIQSADRSQPTQSIQPNPVLNIEPSGAAIEQISSEILESRTLDLGNQLLLDRYKVSQKLVRDNFEHLYLVQDTKQPQQPTCIARQIELDKDSDSLNLATIEKFRREVNIFKQLSEYDDIAKVLDAFQQDRYLYTIQEYVGEDLLSKKLKSDRSMGISDVQMLILEMLKILKNLHHHHILHQNLNPNCFAYRHDGKLLLVDLGIGARLSKTLPQTIETESHQENIYQMPAQWSERFTPNCDIYSVGMIILHALTATPPDRMPIDPITGTTDWRNLRIVSASFARILNKMIRKNPQDRYISIEDVLKDIYQLPVISILLKRSEMLV
jgi:DNA-binding response OmpR family regulator